MPHAALEHFDGRSHLLQTNRAFKVPAVVTVVILVTVVTVVTVVTFVTLVTGGLNTQSAISSDRKTGHSRFL